MVVERVNWSNLMPHKHDKRKSFEKFCYQVANARDSDLGGFTAIDDSGGGSGVEFFLESPMEYGRVTGVLLGRKRVVGFLLVRRIK
jgi:hypothetical protein